MTIPEIRQHPWFQVHLPRYLAVPPPDTLQQAKKVFIFDFYLLRFPHSFAFLWHTYVLH
jgi:hypothetical protein